MRKTNPHNELQTSEKGPGNLTFIYVVVFHLSHTAIIFLFFSMPLSALVRTRGAESVPALACGTHR